MPKISVIIPAYNVEKYIGQCISSVLNQTFNDFELIVIDDASTDGTLKIIESFHDSRMRVIRHSENLGLSDARNSGLDDAFGDYIAFVDGDDAVDKHYLEDLYRTAFVTGADIVQCGIRTFTDKIPDLYKGHGTIEVIMSHNKLLNMFMEAPLETVLQMNKLYRTEVFDWIRFPHDRLHEDEAVIGEELAWCDTYVLLNEDLYFYRLQREGSITSKLTEKRVIDRMLSNEECRQALCGKSYAFDEWAFERELNDFIYGYIQLGEKATDSFCFAKKRYMTQRSILPIKKRIKYSLFFIFPAIAQKHLRKKI